LPFDRATTRPDHSCINREQCLARIASPAQVFRLPALDCSVQHRLKIKVFGQLLLVYSVPKLLNDGTDQSWEIHEFSDFPIGHGSEAIQGVARAEHPHFRQRNIFDSSYSHPRQIAIRRFVFRQ
jgi:hypothetical protein